MLQNLATLEESILLGIQSNLRNEWLTPVFIFINHTMKSPLWQGLPSFPNTKNREASLSVFSRFCYYWSIKPFSSMDWAANSTPIFPVL